MSDPDQRHDAPPPSPPTLSAQVIAAALEVYRHMGPGWHEGVYQQSLVHELTLRGIPFRQQVPLTLGYKGKQVGFGRADLIVAERLVVELKSVESLARAHVAQVVSYLRAARCRVGLLINFNAAPLSQGIRRIVAPGADPRGL